jgi:hypothetical protein
MPLPLIWLAIGAVGTLITKKVADNYTENKSVSQQNEFATLMSRMEADADEAERTFQAFAIEHSSIRKTLAAEMLETIDAADLPAVAGELQPVPEQISVILDRISADRTNGDAARTIVQPSMSPGMATMMRGATHMMRFQQARELAAAIALATAVIDSVKRLGTVRQNEQHLVEMRTTCARNQAAFAAAKDAYAREIEVLREDFDALRSELQLLLSSGLRQEAAAVARILGSML